MRNWLTLSIQKEARYGGSEKERSLWYHGTSATKSKSILSEGLVPFYHNKTWDEDPESSFHGPSRVSLGGIYLTTSLMTARISALNTASKNKSSVINDDRSIVIVEVQPRSLVMDEDNTIWMGHTFDQPWLVAEAFMARELGSNHNFVETSRENYVKSAIENNQQRLKSHRMNQGLVERLKKLLRDGWDIALNRQAAHVYEKKLVIWNDVFWRNCSKELQKKTSDAIDNAAKTIGRDAAYADIMDKTVPKPPSVSEAEQDYATHIDIITKTLKTLARPNVKEENYHNTARSLTPIGFSGKNKIVCIINYRYDPETYGDYSERVKVIYGEMPAQFVKEWERHIGDLIVVDNLHVRGKETKEIAASFNRKK